MRTLVYSLCLVALTGCTRPPSVPPDLFAPGISQTLARERAARVSDVGYDLLLALPAAATDRVAGRAVITFSLSDVRMPLALDFEPNAMGRLKSVDASGVLVEPALASGHLVLPTSVLRPGANRVVIDFDAGDAPLNWNDDFLYTIFVPARAHEAFPCFDQPDLKARFTLTLDVPDGWTTIANGALTAQRAEKGRVRQSFAQTEPIPTYLFAFAAGRLSVEEAVRNGRTFRMVHRETDAAKVARNKNAIFDLHETALTWLERYTGLPYPFGKFDFFLVPAFQFAGMEHPGAVFYNASNMLLDASATQNQLLDRASTISHETAHMWFGDLVTMDWFTDVWMKEVFANFMAAKIVNPSFPGIDHDLRFLHAHYPAAYDVDRTAGTNAIRQPLDNLENAGTLYGSIIYQKAPIVMRQLETIVGADRLRDGLREYLARHRFANASWPDLIGVLDALTADDLTAWSRAWVEEAGRPIVMTELTTAGGTISSLRLVQRDPVQTRNQVWTQRLQIALGYTDHVDLVPFTMAASMSNIEAARGRPAPLYVLPNGGGIGYGQFHLDKASLAWLSMHTPDVPDALTRGSAWVTLWDALLEGDISTERLLDLALKALPRERDELNVQRILSVLVRAYWKFSPDSLRTTRAASIETVLRNGLARASTSSLKSAYFSALRDVALTPSTLTWLTRVWHGDERVTGLPLAEADFIVLAEELAVRGVDGWRSIVDQQAARTQNPDRRARLQFVAPALSSEAAERERFFESLGTVANRRREPWVLDGLHYLHHPLRAVASQAYLAPSLEMLLEIQQTGDIFFPKRWMDATLSGHRTPAAAGIVRTFLAGVPPTYPDRLRRIVLASADDLFRAAAR